MTRRFGEDDGEGLQADEHDEQDERDNVARVLRALRKQEPCSVTADLITEWQRRAKLLQCFRRADVQWQRSGKTPIRHVVAA